MAEPVLWRVDVVMQGLERLSGVVDGLREKIERVGIASPTEGDTYKTYENAGLSLNSDLAADLLNKQSAIAKDIHHMSSRMQAMESQAVAHQLRVESLISGYCDLHPLQPTTTVGQLEARAADQQRQAECIGKPAEISLTNQRTTASATTSMVSFPNARSEFTCKPEISLTNLNTNASTASSMVDARSPLAAVRSRFTRAAYVKSADSLKWFVRTNHPKSVYDTRNMYHETGFFQHVARQEWFENVSLTVIVLNAIWMYPDTDFNNADTLADTKLAYALVDIMFYSYYVGELLIRFLAFKRKRDCCRDSWFIFDSFLVFLNTMDLFVMSLVEYAFGLCEGGCNLLGEPLRLCRLGRLSRMTRVLRHFPEMFIMIKGIVTALHTVVYTLALLGIVTYVFAIAIRNMVPHNSSLKTDYFPTVPETVLNLCIHGTFLDNLSGFVLALRKDSVPCLILALLYAILSALLIMNLLIGVLCEVVSTVAQRETETAMSESISCKFFELMSKFDTNEDGLFSWHELAKFLETENCQDELRKFDVDFEALVDMLEDVFLDTFHYGQNVNLTYVQVIDLIVQLRGSKNSSVKDVMAIGKRLNMKFHELTQRLVSSDTPTFSALQAVTE